MRTTIAVALACVLGVSSHQAARADASPEPPADVDCKFHTGTAEVKSASGPMGTTLDLVRAANQGNATFTFKSSTPARVQFRFPGVRNMQSLTVSDAKHSFSCPNVWTGGRSVHWFDKSGRTVTSSALAAVTLVMEANKSGDLEVTLTAARGMDLGSEVKLNWVQFFRVRRGNFAPVMIGD